MLSNCWSVRAERTRKNFQEQVCAKELNVPDKEHFAGEWVRLGWGMVFKRIKLRFLLNFMVTVRVMVSLKCLDLNTPEL